MVVGDSGIEDSFNRGEAEAAINVVGGREELGGRWTQMWEEETMEALSQAGKWRRWICALCHSPQLEHPL